MIFEGDRHPDYYKGSNKDGRQIEVFDVIDQFVGGDFYLGNVLKYVCRAGKKSKETKAQDLKKAEHYIREAIRRTQKEEDEQDLKKAEHYIREAIRRTQKEEDEQDLVREALDRSPITGREY